VDGAAERPVVAIFGAFDTGDLGEVALRRVIETEVSRRRPDIDVVAMAPFGAERPIPGDEGRPARPLPPVRDAEGLAVEALIISGDVLIGDRGWAARYDVGVDAINERGVAALALAGTRAGTAAAPMVVWFGVGAPGDADADASGLAGRDVWVRDPATQERLGGTAVQSGDPLLLASRVFSADTLRRRADLLRMCGALPAGRRLVVEVAPGTDASVSRALAEGLERALRAAPKLSVVVLRLDPARSDAPAVLEVAGLVAERVHHLPAWTALDDIAAAMSGAVAVLASTPAGAHLAAALGAPVALMAADPRSSPAIAVLGPEPASGIDAFLRDVHTADIGEAVHTLDAAFAELAERLPRHAGAAPATTQADPVESALAILQQRLVDERTALQAELSRIQAELEHLQASPEHRIARPIREGYQRWQRRRT
jgi:hypothetical protein